MERIKLNQRKGMPDYEVWYMERHVEIKYVDGETEDKWECEGRSYWELNSIF